MATENPQKNTHERSTNKYQRSKDILKAAEYLFPEEKVARNTANFILEQRKKQQERSESARKNEFERKETEKTKIVEGQRGETGFEDVKEHARKVGRETYEHMRKGTFELAEKVFKDAKIPIDREVLETLITIDQNSSNYPERPHFPVIIFCLAVIKDFLDAGLVVTVVGAIPASIFGFFISLALFFWTFGKTKWWQGKVYKKFMKKGTKMAIMTTIEVTPYLQVIPAASIYVLLAHYRDTRLVKAMWKSVELVIEAEKGNLPVGTSE